MYYSENYIKLKRWYFKCTLLAGEGSGCCGNVSDNPPDFLILCVSMKTTLVD